MAEDDDDETFGDFAFAPPLQSTSKPPSAAAASDGWGDFLNSPQQSNPSDPPAWTKPRGALPLSIFGGAEDEEEEKGNSSVGDWDLDQRKSSVNNGAADFNSKLGGKDVPNSQNLNVADLYNRYAQIKPDQGRVADSVAVAASVDSEAYLRSNHNTSGSEVGESNGVNLNDKGGVEGQNQFTNNTSMKDDLFGSWTHGFYGVTSNLAISYPNLEMSNTDSSMEAQKQQLEGFDDGDDGDDDDVWEFKDAHIEKVNNNVRKESRLIFKNTKMELLLVVYLSCSVSPNNVHFSSQIILITKFIQLVVPALGVCFIC